jgi:hypothetical protein
MTLGEPDRPTRGCGPCTLCCKVMAINELEKPAGAWCGHCAKGSGCAIYDARPTSCRTFSCAWLNHPELPHNLRPDLTRVVLAFDRQGTRLIAACDPAHPLAWKREPMFSHLKRWAAKTWADGGQVVAAAGPRLWVVTPDEPIDLGEMDPHASFSVVRRLDGGFEAVVTRAD